VSIKEKLFKLDWKFWFSILLNIIFVLYAGFFNIYSPKINLSVDITQQVNALDINESVSGLKVLLNETDLFENNVNLKILTLKIWNNGTRDVEPARFDEENPFSLVVSDGKIIDAAIISTSSPYLSKKIQPTLVKGKIIFPSFFFPAGEYFLLKISILHTKQTQPILETAGTIAGVDNIPITSSYHQATKPSFWSEVTAGSIFVHISRFILYVFAAILTLLGFVFLIVMPIDFIGARLAGRKRKKLVRKFKTIIGKVPDRFYFIIENFIKEGNEGILVAKTMTEHPTFILPLFNGDRKEIRFRSFARIGNPNPAKLEQIDRFDYSVMPKLYSVANSLKENGFDPSNSADVDALQKFLTDFVDFLIKNGEIDVEEEHRISLSTVRALRKYRRQLSPKKKVPYVPVEEDIIESVRMLLPPQPWPKGIDKEIKNQLNISNSKYHHAVDELIKRGYFKKQVNGQLYDKRTQFDE
jgi:hypothetical protein